MKKIKLYAWVDVGFVESFRFELKVFYSRAENLPPDTVFVRCPTFDKEIEIDE